MKPSGSILVHNIGRLLPLTDDRFSIERAAVLVRDGLIEFAGPEEGLDLGKAADVPRLDAAGGLVTPGLVDCHTHLVFAGSRADEFEARCASVSYEEIARRGGGIRRTVAAVRQASMDELVREALPRVWRALSIGITTIEVKSGYGLDLASETKMLEAIRELDLATPVDLIPTFMGAHTFPPEALDREAHCRAIRDEWIPKVAHLARFCDCFCDSIAFTPQECEEILEAGLAHGLRPKLHAEQLQRTGGAQVAARLSAVSADHLDHASGSDLLALARAGTVAVLLPGCAISLARNQFPDARRFLSAGVKVALATDFNPGSCVTQDLLLVGTMAMAFCSLPLRETWAAITAHAADALGLGDRVGRLAPSMQGDLVVFRGDEVVGPFYEWGGGPRVCAVIKRGLVVFNRGVGYGQGPGPHGWAIH